jgi:hypothetical protein
MKDDHTLIVHMDRSLTGQAMFYYIIDTTEDIEILETRRAWPKDCSHCSGTHSLAPAAELVCKIRINPYDHVRWTWYSFLSKECAIRSGEKLIEEAKEATKWFTELKTYLQSDPSLAAHLDELHWFLLELSHGQRKKQRAERLLKSLALLPIPNEVVERSVYFLLRQVEMFNEEAP